MGHFQFECAVNLESIKDKFCIAIRKEMEGENFIMIKFKYLRDEYGLEPKMLGRLFGKLEKRFANCMPEFELKYCPGWDFNLEIRRR